MLVQSLVFKTFADLSLQKLSSGPNDLRFHIMRSSTFFTSFPFTIAIHDLGEFEDLYYAACAKLKELLHGVNLFLTNGFKGPHESYFTYPSGLLNGLGAVNISDFRASLLVHEAILYSNELKDLLNKGVVKKCIRNNKRKCKQSMHDLDSLAQHDSAYAHDIQHDNFNHTKEHVNLRHGTFEKKLGWLAGVQGLQDMSNMNCGMIFGGLAEKYRPIIANEASDGASIFRTSTPEAPQAYQEEVVDRSYISPYNLNERAKKLNAPGGPEMPCICDPECMCAPLCASDPTQNCLCEENGLFARVTEGMDIDDLDVPDLVRRKRQASLNSKSSTSSFITTRKPSPNTPTNAAAYAKAIGPSEDVYGAIDKLEKQRDQQAAQATRNADFPDDMSISSMQLDEMASVNSLFTSSNAGEDDFWQVPSVNRLRTSSLSYREQLRQPFSEQCAYPPRRSSVAQRLFSSRNKSHTTDKRHSTASHITASLDTSGNSRKVIKQAGKRSLADMSFTGLKLALRRDSQIRGGTMRQ